MNYKDLEIWKMARELVIDIHSLSLGLPKIETFEEGLQIRRSIKSVKSTIVEGYGRRRYKSDFIKFLVYAHASTNETIDHLESLYETGSLPDGQLYKDLKQKLDLLGRKLNKFIVSVEVEHNSSKCDLSEKSRIPHPASCISYLKSTSSSSTQDTYSQY